MLGLLMLIFPRTFLRSAFKRRKLRHREVKTFPTSRSGLELCSVQHRWYSFSRHLRCPLLPFPLPLASVLQGTLLWQPPMWGGGAAELPPSPNIHPFTRGHKRMTSNSSLSSSQCLQSLQATLSFHLHQQPLQVCGLSGLLSLVPYPTRLLSS